MATTRSGELVTVTDDKNNVTRQSFDNLGRRTVVDNPDTGKTETTYDLASNPIAKVTANLRAPASRSATAMTSTGWSRSATRSSRPTTSATPTAGRGRVTTGPVGSPSVTDQAGSEDRFYGKLGETTKEVRTVVGDTGSSPKTYTTSYVYDTFGRQQSMVYPDGETLTYQYDSGGMVRAASGVKGNDSYTYVNRLEYDKFGQKAFVEDGNGVKTTYAFDPVMRRLSNQPGRTAAGAQRRQPGQLPERLLRLRQRRQRQVGRQQHRGADTAELRRSVVADVQLRRPGPADRRHRLLPVRARQDQPATPTRWATTTCTTPRPRTRPTRSCRAPAPRSPRARRPTRWPTPTPGCNRTRRPTSAPRPTASTPTATSSAGPMTTTGSNARSSGTRKTASSPSSTTARSRSTSTTTPASGSSSADRRARRRTSTSSTPCATARSAPSTSSSTLPGWRRSWRRRTPTRRTPTTSTPTSCRAPTRSPTPGGKLYEHLEYFPSGEAWIEEKSNTQRTPYRFAGKELDEETGLYYFGARYYDPRTGLWPSTDPALGENLAKLPGRRLAGAGCRRPHLPQPLQLRRRQPTHQDRPRRPKA